MKLEISPALIALIILLVSGMYIHYRGRVRYKFFRQVFDHSTLFAPINIFMYLFSKVPQRPYLALDTLPELKTLSENWEDIKNEAIALKKAEMIKLKFLPHRSHSNVLSYCNLRFFSP